MRLALAASLLGLVLASLVVTACGGDKPPMVPDPDTNNATASAPDASAD